MQEICYINRIFEMVFANGHRRIAYVRREQYSPQTVVPEAGYDMGRSTAGWQRAPRRDGVWRSKAGADSA